MELASANRPPVMQEFLPFRKSLIKTGSSILSVLVLIVFTSFNNKEQFHSAFLSVFQQEVISYFKEVALGFEYGSASGVTRKWKVPMKIFMIGPTSPLEREVHHVVAELNELFSDGFEIQITDRREDSNFVMYFGSRQEFSSLYPADTKNVAASSGLFHIFWNSHNEITRGYIFIRTENTSEQEQRHTIREELTQSLGLGKDSSRYPESIFQGSWTTPTDFAPIDRELVRMLYHPLMHTGADSDAAERIMVEVLSSGVVANLNTSGFTP
jgi:hypothetical protein